MFKEIDTNKYNRDFDKNKDIVFKVLGMLTIDNNSNLKMSDKNYFFNLLLIMSPFSNMINSSEFDSEILN